MMSPKAVRADVCDCEFLSRKELATRIDGTALFIDGYNRGATLAVRRSLGYTRFGSVQTKYVDAARPHFRKKIKQQEAEAAATAKNLAMGLTADGRAKD